MPQAKIVFLIGSLALVGIPPFAGFFSKDSILASALERGWYGDVIYGACMIGVFLTGLYAFRLFFLVFTGEPTPFAREHFHKHDGHEAPLSMRWTVAALAVLAVIGGLLQFAPFWHPLSSWLEPVVGTIAEPTDPQEAVSSVLALVLGAAGVYVAWTIYGARRVKAPRPVVLLERKFYWDELYDIVWYRGAEQLTRGLYAFVERPLIAGSMRAVSESFGLGSRELSLAQTGLVRSYALALAGGLAILAVVFLAVR